MIDMYIITTRIKIIIFALSFCAQLFSTEYLIVTHEKFLSAAEDLAQIYNNSTYPEISLETEVFTLTPELQNSESLNAYILDRIEQDPNIMYLLLMGDEEHIPIKNKTDLCALTDGNGSFTGEFETTYNPSDDLYSMQSDNSGIPQLATGRLPCSTLNEANNWVENINQYINYPTSGLWRNKVVLISDDEDKNGSPISSELSHTRNSDILYDIIEELTLTEIIYGPLYEPVYIGDQRTQPYMTNDIISSINDGVSLISYIGHGDENTWAAEKILDKDRDLNLIDIPDNKLPIWIVGTCYFGRYDNIDSMSESLLFDNNGAISVIGTTRQIFSSVNIEYLEDLFLYISNYINDDDSSVKRLGDAFLSAKQTSDNYYYNYNGQECGGSYLFDILGDPALPLPFSKEDDISYIDELPESVTVLETNSITLNNTNESSLIIKTLDTENTIEYTTGDILQYTNPGSVLFNNTFIENTCYTMPLDIQSCNCNIEMKLFTDETSSYIGATTHKDNISISESTQEANDVLGPTIYIWEENEKNITIQKGGELEVNLEDPSGINLMNSIGHSLQYWFENNNNINTVDGNDFIYSSSCHGGSFKINLPENLEGKTNLYIEAWDNANNETEYHTILDIQTSNEKIFNVYNFPNPFTGNTYFTFQLNEVPSDNILSTITIYTLDGQKINTITSSDEEQFISIKWERKDNNSNIIPNGSYIYKLEVQYNNHIYQKIGKMTKIK